MELGVLKLLKLLTTNLSISGSNTVQDRNNFMEFQSCKNLKI